jgi:hypothetical protein
MFSLFANGAPPPYPMPDAPAIEWAVWGACIGTAAVLGGWAILNRNRPSRDTLVGVFLSAAVVLVLFATGFVVQRDQQRKQEEVRRALQEHSDREAEQRSQP